MPLAQTPNKQRMAQKIRAPSTMGNGPDVTELLEGKNIFPLWKNYKVSLLLNLRTQRTMSKDTRISKDSL
jgi:hypothetical protein